MITGNHPSRKRDNRIQSMAKIYVKNEDEEELFEKAKSYGVTQRTAQDYVNSAIVLSSVIKRKKLFER